MPKVISLKEARKKNLKYYFVKPCKNGHDCNRYVSDRACIQCKSENAKKIYNSLDKDELKRKNRKIYLRHKEKILVRAKKYQKLNKDKFREYSKKWREKNPEKLKQVMKEYRERNYDKVREREKQYKIKNRDEILKKIRKRYHSDPSINERTKERRRNDPSFSLKQKNRRLKSLDKYRERENKYAKFKRKNDLNFKIGQNLRSRFNSAIKRVNKTDRRKWTSVINLLGCSIEEFKIMISKKFKKGMNWNNYGEWHLDHIKPVAKFDLTKKDEQVKAFNYKNLQPLWAEENLKKSDKY